MIVYEEAPPGVKAGELDLAGRRAVARAVACSGECGPPRFRFDPVERRIVARRDAGTASCGPADPQAWSEALSKAPDGALLVEGSAGAAEAVRGTFAAAAEGVRRAGRGAFLLDPGPAAADLPSFCEPTRSGPRFVVLAAWSPDEPAFRDGLEALRTAARAGIAGGVVWPVLPGWTDSADFVSGLLASAREAGARFASPVAPAADVDARRAAVLARQHHDPAGSERFFDTMFHAPWSEPDALASALEAARAAVREAGLAIRPPRPATDRQPAANVRAAERLEDLAAEAGDEHTSARLLAAVRWIDSCGRDLDAIRREGNLARVFPLGGELAAEIERALTETP